MQKHKKKNEKNKIRHDNANPKQTTGGAMNKRNVQGKVSPNTLKP